MRDRLLDGFQLRAKDRNRDPSPEQDERAERPEDQRGEDAVREESHEGEKEEQAGQDVSGRELAPLPSLILQRRLAPPEPQERRDEEPAKSRREISHTPTPKSMMARRNAPIFSIQPISGTPPRRPSRNPNFEYSSIAGCRCDPERLDVSSPLVLRVDRVGLLVPLRASPWSARS